MSWACLRFSPDEDPARYTRWYRAGTGTGILVRSSSPDQVPAYRMSRDLL